MKRKSNIVLALFVAILCIVLSACNNNGSGKVESIEKTPLSPLCVSQYSRKTSNSNVSVDFCDCNALGIVMEKSGSTASLRRHTIAEIPAQTYASFDTLSLSYAAFLEGYTITDEQNDMTVSSSDTKYINFFSEAKNLFSSVEYVVASEVKYNLDKSVIIGVNKPFDITVDSNYSYGSMLEMVAGLFGYSSVETFKTYAHNIIAAFGSEEIKEVETSRLDMDGAIYTANGSYILPYAVSSERSNNFVVLVILNKEGVMSVWVSNIDSLGYAVDVDKVTDSATVVHLYGRCRLFETASGYYRFSFTGDTLPAGTYAKMDIVSSDGLSKEITIMLLPEYAPKSVENFISYAESGFYDGTVIHRIVKNGCLQGGGYTYKNGYRVKSATQEAIEGEFATNGHPENTIGHCPGIISMARTDAVNSATSQFFLVFGDYHSWDGAYAGFGFMPYQEDIDFITKLGSTTSTSSSDYPTSRRITIKTVKIENINNEE